MITTSTIFVPLYFCILFLVFTPVIATNPVISHKYTADPGAMVYNGRVYVYCSHDDNNRAKTDGSVDYRIIDYTLISSDDMVNWTDHGEVFHAKKNTTWANLAFAPSCVEKNGKFYLYFPDGGNSIGVAVADRPQGPFTDPIGKSLINRSMPNCNVEWCFDPCAFIDDDGQGYLYFGGGMNTVGTNLRVIKLNDDMISTNGTAMTLEAPKSFEASYMHKYNGTYYFSYATDGASKIDYLTGSSPLTNFEHKGTILDNPTLDGENINKYNNSHSSIVTFKNNWYLFYHDRRLSGNNEYRNVCVDLLTYREDGSINPVTVSSESVPQVKRLNPCDTVQSETIDRQSGIKTDTCSEGGMMVTSISDGDYTNVSGVDFGDGVQNFQIRAASASNGGTIELRLGSTSGTLVGTCTIRGTGGWTTWKNFSCNITNCSGIKNLYLVYKGTDEPFRLDWYFFTHNAVGIIKPESNTCSDKSKKSQSYISVQKNHSLGSAPLYDLAGRAVTKPKHTNTKTCSRGMYVSEPSDK